MSDYTPDKLEETATKMKFGGEYCPSDVADMLDAFAAVLRQQAALAQNTQGDPTYPFESTLAELIEAVDPSIESGDVIADAHSAALIATARRSAERATVPDGWVLVPREPSQEMAAALGYMATRGFNACYESMLAAAPSQPKDAQS